MIITEYKGLVRAVLETLLRRIKLMPLKCANSVINKGFPFGYTLVINKQVFYAPGIIKTGNASGFVQGLSRCFTH